MCELVCERENAGGKDKIKLVFQVAQLGEQQFSFEQHFC